MENVMDAVIARGLADYEAACVWACDHIEHASPLFLGANAKEGEPNKHSADTAYDCPNWRGGECRIDDGVRGYERGFCEGCQSEDR